MRDEIHSKLEYSLLKNTGPLIFRRTRRKRSSNLSSA